MTHSFPTRRSSDLATNGFRSRRATRLARGDSACSLAGEPITEQAGLGGFAHPLPALKRDQPPCPGLGPPNPNSERKPAPIRSKLPAHATASAPPNGQPHGATTPDERHTGKE